MLSKTKGEVVEEEEDAGEVRNILNAALSDERLIRSDLHWTDMSDQDFLLKYRSLECQWAGYTKAKLTSEFQASFLSSVSSRLFSKPLYFDRGIVVALVGEQSPLLATTTAQPPSSATKGVARPFTVPCAGQIYDVQRAQSEPYDYRIPEADKGAHWFDTKPCDLNALQEYSAPLRGPQMTMASALFVGQYKFPSKEGDPIVDWVKVKTITPALPYHAMACVLHRDNDVGLLYVFADNILSVYDVQTGTLQWKRRDIFPSPSSEKNEAGDGEKKSSSTHHTVLSISCNGTAVALIGQNHILAIVYGHKEEAPIRYYHVPMCHYVKGSGSTNFWLGTFHGQVYWVVAGVTPVTPVPSYHLVHRVTLYRDISYPVKRIQVRGQWVIVHVGADVVLYDMLNPVHDLVLRPGAAENLRELPYFSYAGNIMVGLNTKTSSTVVFDRAEKRVHIIPSPNPTKLFVDPSTPGVQTMFDGQCLYVLQPSLDMHCIYFA